MNMRVGDSGNNHNIGPIGNGKSKKGVTGAMRTHNAALGALKKAGDTNSTASKSMKAGGHTATPGSRGQADSVTKRLFG